MVATPTVGPQKAYVAANPVLEGAPGREKHFPPQWYCGADTIILRDNRLPTSLCGVSRDENGASKGP